MPEETDEPRSHPVAGHRLAELGGEPPAPPEGAQAGAQPPERVAPAELADVFKGSDFLLSSRRLWLLSMAAYHGGHPLLGRWLKNFNSVLYHNSLPCECRVSGDVRLGHHGIGTVLHPKVVVGRGVKIFQNVTMAVRPTNGPHEIVIEDGAVIGANSVIMTPRHRGIRIGRGARVGAGAVITHDVPERMIAISAPVELRPRAQRSREGAELDLEDGEEE
jgi:serine acetyltransferase